MKRAKISRQRKSQLMRRALRYCGTLVSSVVANYTAFDDLPEHERAFIDEYIVSVGDRLTAQSERYDEKTKQAAYALLRALQKGQP